MSTARDTSPAGHHNANPQFLDYCERWGYSFRWTRSHMSKKELDAMRTSYDELGSNAYETLKSIIDAIETSEKGRIVSSSNQYTLDLYAILRDHCHDDPVLNRLWEELHTIPEWIDWKQIERGQRFFARYALANIGGLFFQGFLHGNAVSEHRSPLFFLSSSLGLR